MLTAHDVPNRPVLLVILDGFGVNPAKQYNAIHLAKTPRFDEYFARYPHTTLEASGLAVGLPKGQMGNSEVGHTTLGCGAIVRQDLVRIDDAIKDGSFYKNSSLRRSIEQAKAHNRSVHLLGLVSDGGVHSHISHLIALLELCKQMQVKPLLHMIADGRDTAPKSALKYVDMLQPILESSNGQIATICGRFYAMDRDKRWDRTEAAWRLLTELKGNQAKDIYQAIDEAYQAGQTDEFILPTVLEGADSIQADDAVIFFNFRNDRPRQLTAALSQARFAEFDRGTFHPVIVTCMTEYNSKFALPIAFHPEKPETCLAEIISQHNFQQFHCAETEKYAHVTFFFNGGHETAYPGEVQCLIPSPKVATYDLSPAMSAKEVADNVIQALESKKYGFIVVNFANGDMVGHTAIQNAVIQAVETLDHEVGRVLDAALAQDYATLLTADHGNCEEMIDTISQQPHTQHTTYPVPLILIDKQPYRLTTGGGLAHIAPTVLKLMGLPQSEHMIDETLVLE